MVFSVSLFLFLFGNSLYLLASYLQVRDNGSGCWFEAQRLLCRSHLSLHSSLLEKPTRAKERRPLEAGHCIDN